MVPFLEAALGRVAFGWMMPGEVRAFDDDKIDEATAWLVRAS
jgi:hypothetical protein